MADQEDRNRPDPGRTPDDGDISIEFVGPPDGDDPLPSARPR